jgi:hypothetical protein
MSKINKAKRQGPEKALSLEYDEHKKESSAKAHAEDLSHAL